jgi:hypothetical protein
VVSVGAVVVSVGAAVVVGAPVVPVDAAVVVVDEPPQAAIPRANTVARAPQRRRLIMFILSLWVRMIVER